MERETPMKKWTRTGDRTVFIQVRCPPVQKRDLQVEAERRGKTLTAFLLEAASECASGIKESNG